MISSYETDPVKLGDALMSGENLTQADILSGLISLCGIVNEQRAKIEVLEKRLCVAANTASCLANGIVPD